ncbi:MAG TPA: toprim domain-containing protein [Streptosporangiaceae bacterium]
MPASMLPDGLAALAHLAWRHGFSVEHHHRVAHGACAGHLGVTQWPDRQILLPASLPPDREILALAHQIGHILLHSGIARVDPGGTVPCHGLRKVEADSVAYLTIVHLGIDPAPITFPHVSSWAGTDPRAQPAAAIRAATARITSAAQSITGHLEAGLRPRRVPTARAAAPADDLLPPTAPGDLVAVNEAALAFFRARLSGSWVPGYLTSRGLSPATQEQWQAGHAPAAWDALTRHLRAAGYPDTLLQAAGLARRSRRGTLIDVFRNRAILPIRAPDGTLAAFIGRAPDPQGKGVPKYLNSRRTSLYDKSTILFGLCEAREALAAGGRPVLAEGPLDAIAITVAAPGRYAGLAPCGTALTPQHVDALSQATDLAATGVLAAFDPDQAGRRAAVRAYHLLTPLTSAVWTAVLPAGGDPAQILADRGGAGLVAALGERVVPLADLVTDAELGRWSRWLDHAEGQLNALHATAAVIAALRPDHVSRQVARLASRLNLDHATVTDALIAAVPAIVRADRTVPAKPPPGSAPATRDAVGGTARGRSRQLPPAEQASRHSKETTGLRDPPAGRTGNNPQGRDFPAPARQSLASAMVPSPAARRALSSPPPAQRSAGRRVAG